MKYIPHAYQAYCERQIVEKPALALWLDMGLGKTSITLSAVNELKFNRFEVRKVLVIAPKKWPRPPGRQRQQSGTIRSIFGSPRCLAVYKNGSGL